MTNSISNYCDSNTLLIPQSLLEMSDAHPVMVHNEAAIFYKCIKNNMTDIEFYTGTPCLAFVLNGEETFTSYDEKYICLKKHEMLFMPKNIYMISDFFSKNGPLEAFLFFFDQSIIKDFLKRVPLTTEQKQEFFYPYKVPANKPITNFMNAINDVYKNFDATPDLLYIKLMELLFLIDTLDDNKKLRNFLTNTHATGARRNIKHLMKEHCFHNLSVKDFAKLSGRSISTFTRDFKREFGNTPSQWLIDVRLEKAMQLIKETTLSVTEVSHEIGYDNISHFIKAFKEKYGQTPKKVRSEITY